MLVRAIVSIVLVWLLAPHEPNLGLDSPRTLLQASTAGPAQLCGTQNAVCDRIAWQAVVATVRTLDGIHAGLMNRVDRVRADFDANLKRP